MWLIITVWFATAQNKPDEFLAFGTIELAEEIKECAIDAAELTNSITDLMLLIVEEKIYLKILTLIGPKSELIIILAVVK